MFTGIIQKIGTVKRNLCRVCVACGSVLSGVPAFAAHDEGLCLLDSVRAAHQRGGGTVRLADGEHRFYSSSVTNMRFHVSNHDQPDVRPVFLPFVGITNVAVVAKNAKFVMHVTWRNNGVKRHGRYRSWGKKPFEVVGSGNVDIVDKGKGK